MGHLVHFLATTAILKGKDIFDLAGVVVTLSGVGGIMGTGVGVACRRLGEQGVNLGDSAAYGGLVVAVGAGLFVVVGLIAGG